MWSRDFRFGNHCPGARRDNSFVFYDDAYAKRCPGMRFPLVSSSPFEFFHGRRKGSRNKDAKVFRNCLQHESCIRQSDQNLCIESFPPRHATVDGKVERIWKADEHVDEEDYLVRQLVVKELNQTEIYSLSIHLVLPSNHFNNYCL